MSNLLKISLPVAGLLMSLSAFGSPWQASEKCQLNQSQPAGLYPQAAKTLSDLELTPRITQGLNQSISSQNVHGVDDVIDKVPYTAAVDISVKCLVGDQDSKIKDLLRTLAESGFVGWYRQNGRDGWKGPNHVHAIWIKQKLKPSLAKQVNSWLQGKNGLKSNLDYEYWQPTADLKGRVKGYLREASVGSR